MKRLSLLLFLASLNLVSYGKKDVEVQWIAATPGTELSTDLPQYFYYRKTFKLKKPVVTSILKVLSANPYNIWINGVPVIFDGNTERSNEEMVADTVWMNSYLIKGLNSISIRTRLIPEEGKTPDEKIFVQLFREDSLNIVSDDTWMSGIGNTLKIEKKDHYTISYQANDDIFSDFHTYHYNTKVRDKSQWHEALIAGAQPISSKVNRGHRILTHRVHQYKVIDFPKFLKEKLHINWELNFAEPVYFGFRLESIGQKVVTAQLLTKEYGLIDINYYTKDGEQEFLLDIPLTISIANLDLPAYLKINKLYFKELAE